MRANASLASLPVLLLALALPAAAQPIVDIFPSPSPETAGFFGSALAAVPDADGDGVDDILVGASGEGLSLSLRNAGGAHLLSGATGTPIYSLVSPNQARSGSFGFAASGTSDLDGDGRGDLFIGAYNESPGARPDGAGRAYVFSGATSTLLYTLASPNEQSDGFFGFALSTVPDADGDGFDDLLIGAYQEDEGTGPERAGRAYLFSGATGTLLYTLVSPNEGVTGFFGFAVSGVGDLDGDDRGDLLVGAWQEPGPNFGAAGRAYVFSGATGALLHDLVSPNEDLRGYFGRSVASTPDTDGDGRDDLLVGAVFEEAAGVPASGRAYLFSGATAAPLHTLTSASPQIDGRFGEEVAGIPDTDGDGYGDLLVGTQHEEIGSRPLASGSAHLFSGATGALIRQLASPHAQPIGSFGLILSGISDLDGDGRGDFLVGAPGERSRANLNGEGLVYLFSGSLSEDLRFSATARSPLTVAPGDSVAFAYTIVNATTSGADGDLFFVARQGTSTVASGRIVSGSLAAGESLRGAYTQQIPANAPAGTYTYDLNIGQFPSKTIETETFEIVVTGSAAARGAQAWAVLEATPWDATEASTTWATAAATADVVAFPNPFRTTATLRFTLAESGSTRLAIYDVLGREVAVLVDGERASGPHAVSLDGSGLPAGVYVWRLETDRGVETGHLTLVR